MSRSAFRYPRVVLPLTLAALLFAAGTLSALAQPAPASTIHFDVANPSAGDSIHVGGDVIQGSAFDREAQAGSGIDRVQIFIGNRDDAGVLIGQAALGDTPIVGESGDDDNAVSFLPATLNDPNAWVALVNVPSNDTGTHTLYFYARSAVSGVESIVTVPVTIVP